MAKAPGVRQRGTTWSAVWRDANGKQQEKGGFAKQADAVAFRDKQRVALRTGHYVGPQQGRMTVGEQYEMWQKNRRVSRARRAMEASIYKVHIEDRWGKVPLERVQLDDVQAWVNDLADHGKRTIALVDNAPQEVMAPLSPSTVTSCFRLLSQTLDAAVRSQRLAINPVAQHVKTPGAGGRRLTHDTVLDAAELSRVVGHVRQERWRAFVFASGWLGWRLGEGLGIRRCDVNLLHNTITIGRVVVEEVSGRARPRVGGKTINAERVVPLSPTVRRVLELHMEEWVDDPHPEAFLFTLGNGCHPTRGNLLRQVLQPAVAAAGLAGRGITFRQLRHTAASLMFAAGVSPILVSQWLGHYKPSFTMDTYTHILKRDETVGTDAMEAAILAVAR